MYEDKTLICKECGNEFEVDVHPILFIMPAVFCGKSHPVKQEAVKQLGVCGEILELRACHQQTGGCGSS